MIGFTPSYTIAIIARVFGGICAGALWPMISAYGMSLVHPNDHGKAVAVIMGGTTVGMSVGLPLMTWIGTTFNFHIEYIVMRVFVVIIVCFVRFFYHTCQERHAVLPIHHLQCSKTKVSYW